MDYLIQTPMQLGNALQSRRKSLNLSQKETAKLAGLLVKTISHLENNYTSASVESLFELLSALELNVILSPINEKGNQLKESEL